MTHVVVVGAGIAGLSAAYELSGGESGRSNLDVTVFEAGRFGGKLLDAALGARRVDVGPDGFLARRPEAVALVTELGAADQLEAIGAHGAWVHARGRLRRLPPGLAYGVPTRLRDLRTSDAIGMLGVAGALRAAVDLVAPLPAARSALPDRAIGPLIADKLGHRVVDVLVDPLVGGIHAGRVKDLSAAAVYPPVLAAGQGRGSLMRALQAAAGDAPVASGPAFMTLRGGLSSLPDLLVGVLRGRGVSCEPAREVTGLHRGQPGAERWTVESSAGAVRADAVILATPPAATSALLAAHDANAASMVASIDAAGVAIVTLALAADGVTLPDEGTGALIPAGTRRGTTTYLATALSFLDRKWPHLASDGEVLLRVSTGRVDDARWSELDDADLVGAVCEELGDLVGLDAAPRSALVTRWPSSFPQYRVNHLVRVDGIEAAAGALGGIAVAGAAYRGVGIPACIANGRGAARSITGWLAEQT